MSEALNDLVVNDVFVNILSEKLSDEDLHRIFAFHGEIKFPKSTNNAKKLRADEQIVIHFKSRNHLLRTMTAVCTKVEDIRKNDFLINSLPDDCLAHIFSFLPIVERLTAERVCKRWRYICERGWDDMKELQIDYEYSDNIIHLILKRCGRFLKKLTILDSPKHSNCLSSVIQFCKLDQLEEIEIFFDHDYKEEEIALNICNLLEIFEKTRKLVAVTIRGDLSTLFTINHLNFVNPKNLRKLDLDDSSYDEISINPYRFPNLKELKLEGIDIIGDEMKKEKESLMGLEKMQISWCDIPQNFIQRIGTFTNLQELTLQMNTCDINNEHIRHIARHCYKIKKMNLDFSDSSSVTSDCFQYLGQMSSLEVLELRDFDNMDNRNIVYLTNVKKLFFICRAEIIRGDGLMELIGNSSKLEELKLYHIDGLNITFLNNVRQIFHRGKRQKFLLFTIEVAPGNEHLGVPQEVTEHPLLDLRVFSFLTRKKD